MTVHALAGLELDAAGHLAAPPIAAPPSPPPLPSGRYVDVGGAFLWTVDTGSGGTGADDTGTRGDPVLLLHSGVGSVELWAHQLASLSRAGFRAMAYDRRGHGRSRDVGGVHDEAADALAIADRLGLDTVHLVGVAQGARIANQMALRHPDRVRTLTLASSMAGVRLRGPQGAGTAPLLPELFAKLPAWFRELGPAYRAADPEGVRRWIAVESAGADRRPPDGPPPGRIDPDALRALTCPVLLLTGDADPFLPPPMVRALAGCYAHTSLAVLPECGHSPQWERPDLFGLVLETFLRTASEPGG
ncbi:alpha/beta fold hydrolase [Streptomyces sp. NPDC001315]|uniref:alpha/beta fold hydrolase n=1 Tax=Streptomyces sp. NPDC001315 TaxID=3364562 RepID=UPI0036BEA005